MQMPRTQLVVPILAGLMAGLITLHSARAQDPPVPENGEPSTNHAVERIFSIRCGEGVIQPSPPMMQIMLSYRSEAIEKRLPKDVSARITQTVVEDIETSGSGGKAYLLSVGATTDFANMKHVADAVLAELKTRLEFQLVEQPLGRIESRRAELEEEHKKFERDLRESKLQLTLIDDESSITASLTAKQTQLSIEKAMAKAKALLFEKRLKRISRERDEYSQKGESLRDLMHELEGKLNEGDEILKFSREIANVERTISEVDGEKDFWSKEIQQLKNEISKLAVDQALKDQESKILEEMLEKGEKERVKKTVQRLELQMRVARLEQQQASLAVEFAAAETELRALKNFEFRVWD